jgi:hypothetical protein
VIKTRSLGWSTSILKILHPKLVNLTRAETCLLQFFPCNKKNDGARNSADPDPASGAGISKYLRDLSIWGESAVQSRFLHDS